jgi:membrane protein YqaA with SNARE-associated domain
MSDLATWLLQLVNDYGYFGAFLASLIGNLTVIIPTPYAFVITALGTSLNPLILGIVCGLGATLGEISAYIIGRAGRVALNDEQKNRVNIVNKLLDKYGAWILIVFAITPLPDDILLLPMGVMKYDVKTILVTLLIGKTMLALVLAYAGHYSVGFISTSYESYGYVGIALTLIVMLAIVVAMLKIDWEKVAARL